MNNIFRTQFIRYIHTRSLNRRDLIVSLMLPRMVLRRNARIMIESFRESHYQTRGIDKNQPFELAIEPYAGQNPYVRKMMRYLVRHLERDLVGAYLHGSLGRMRKSLIATSTRWLF